MHESLENLTIVRNKISKLVNEKQLKTNPKIIAVTKTFPISEILPLIENGHIHFGENKVNEAKEKWSNIKNQYKNIKLHMVGGLQSNKAKKAVQIFDYLHSLDNEKLALKISKYENELNKKTKLFIQVNLAEETQKSGITLKILDISKQIETSSTYVDKDQNSFDLREQFNQRKKPVFPNRPYFQVFSDTGPFLQDLSIIDLIFNMGPEAGIYLKNCLD